MQDPVLLVPVPHGHRAHVLSDLDLVPATRPDSLAVREFTRLLDDIDDAAVIVVAGNCFDLRAHGDASTAIAETLGRLPALRAAMARFGTEPYRRLILLAGDHDWALLHDPAACAALGELGIEVAESVTLRVWSARGARELPVTVGSVATHDVPALGVEEQRLEDPSARTRFAASRLLYRNLGRWIAIVLAAMVLVDIAGDVVAFINRVSHGHIHLGTTHHHDVWSVVEFNLLVLVAAAAVLAIAAALVVRWRFRHDHPVAADVAGEPLSVTDVGERSALDVARAEASEGRLGAIIGGTPRPALVFLDRGMCVAPGPSRPALVERRGLLGLPPVFADVARFGVVEVEAATEVHVRLQAVQEPPRRRTRWARALGSTPRHPEPPTELAVLGSWPQGDPWPVGDDRIAAQRRERLVRRCASALLVLTGLTDVIFAAIPPLRSRLHEVESYLPVGIVQSAAAITAIAGVVMIMLARGVRRGQRRAWAVAVVALVVTVGAHLLRGGSVRDSLLAIVVLAILVFGRQSFTATSDAASVRSLVPRLLGIGVVAVAAATVGAEFTDIGHHTLPSLPIVAFGCAERLVGITTVGLPDRIADFLDPAMLAVGVALIVSLLYLGFRPVVDRRLSSRATSAERRLADLRARDLVRRHGRGTLDYFALRDDKQVFFHRDSLVAYAVYGGVALLSPDPIGPAAERTEVFSAFRAFAEGHGWTIGVMGAGAEWLPIYQAAGLHSIYLGDEAVVDCPSFSLAGGHMKGLRQACTRIERHGYTVEFLDPATIDPAQVNGILELITKLRRGEAERGFSMMLGRMFDPRDTGLLLTVVKDPAGQPAAVCQFVPSPAINGYSLDLMRRDPGPHPNGLLDYALCSTIAHLARTGGQGLSLNFAAFRSVLDGEKGDGPFSRVERWALRRLSGVLPIESLWSFNAKYDPRWLPRYLVYPAAESFVPVVAATLRAEALTEIPVIGRLLANDPTNRPGTVVPDDVLARAREAEAARH